MTRVIETARLRLRGWRDDDVEPWAAMNADERVMEFFVSPLTRERSYDAARLMARELESDGYGWFVMEIKERPGFSGVVALCNVRYDVPFEPRREIGWRLPVHAWGSGYATEGARALLEYAFGELGWDRLVSFTAAANARSRRVMERLGMTRDPAEDFDHPRVPAGHPIRRHVLYRLSASEVPQ